MKNQSKKGDASIKDNNASANQSNASAISKDIQKNIESKLRDIPRGGGINSPQIYKIDPKKWDAMNDKERKSFRRKKRSILQKFSSDILGKDRSDSERLNASKEFISYFKDAYISDRLDASAIYQGSNDSKRKELSDMIEIIRLLNPSLK